jgi:hypothetical protein
MKKSFILLALTLLVFESIAQVRPARKKHFDKFYKSTTYIVEDRDPFSEFNQHLREAMEQHWTITPFEVISFDDFHRLRTNEDASFMVLADIKQKNLDEVYVFINFVMGDKKRDFESMPDLASVPLAYRDADDYDYLYKMGAFVKFMQTHVSKSDDTPRMRLARIMNVNDDRLKQMELWLLENELAPEVRTAEAIRRHYPYTVKIVTPEQINEAIAQDRADVAFLHKLGPEDATRLGRGKCWKFIISAGDGSVLYSSSHDVDRNNPDAFLVEDFKDIAK